MKSEELFQISKKFLSGGVDSPVRSYKPYPFFAERSEGPYIYDVDKNYYIDYCLAYGPLVLGHTHPDVMKSVKEQLELGSAYGVPTEKEIELAKLVVNKIPCAEMVRFVNSGTEATMSAVRLARAYTGRKKIVKFEGTYHGAHDYVLVKSGSGAIGVPDSLGVPEETTRNTLVIPFNSREAVDSLIEKQSQEIAAIIVEPVMGNVGCIPPRTGYLKFLREITAKHNIVLIFDEVITGFRVAEGGAQEYFNVTPDLVTLGKILGGGFPIGALAGKKELMEMLTPLGSVYQAGTFNGNPVSVTAGLTTLKLLNHNFYEELNHKGDYMRSGINDIMEDNNLEYKIAGLSSMFQLYFTDKDVWNYMDAKSSDSNMFDQYFHNLLKESVFIPPSQFECCFISLMHGESELDTTLEAMNHSIKKIC